MYGSDVGNAQDKSVLVLCFSVLLFFLLLWNCKEHAERGQRKGTTVAGGSFAPSFLPLLHTHTRMNSLSLSLSFRLFYSFQAAVFLSLSLAKLFHTLCG